MRRHLDHTTVRQDTGEVVPPDSVATRYPAAWAEYKKRLRRMMFTWVAILPAELLVGLPLSWAFGSNFPFLVIAVPALGAFFVAAVRYSDWPCPRCGMPFHRTFFRNWTFARRCLHCKLPKRTR